MILSLGNQWNDLKELLRYNVKIFVPIFVDNQNDTPSRGQECSVQSWRSSFLNLGSDLIRFYNLKMLLMDVLHCCKLTTKTRDKFYPDSGAIWWPVFQHHFWSTFFFFFYNSTAAVSTFQDFPRVSDMYPPGWEAQLEKGMCLDSNLRFGVGSILYQTRMLILRNLQSYYPQDFSNP